MRGRKFVSFPLVVCFTMLALLSASAQSGIDQLRREWVGKTVLVRGFYDGEELNFDAGGNLIGTAPADSWTAAQVEISKITSKQNRLIVEGKRMALGPDATGKLKPTYRRYQFKRDKFEIETVKVIVHGLGVDRAEPVLQKIFILDAADWISVIPDYWRPYLKGELDKELVPNADGVVRVLEDGTRVYKCGNGGPIAAPKANYTPDPEYSEPARRARYGGRGVYLIVVGPDGHVREVQVKKPAGWGLDDDAVAVLKHWEFSPATNQGAAVAVQLNVETSWRLY